MTRVDYALDDVRSWSEAELQRHIIDHARGAGWGVSVGADNHLIAEAAGYGVPIPPLDGLIFHPRWSIGSEPGWPDLTLVRRSDRRFELAELKSQSGRLSARQERVIDLLRAVGLTVHVWRPSDLPAIYEVLR